MNTYTAMAYVPPLNLAEAPPEPLALEATLPALVERVRALAPGAPVSVFGRQAVVTCAGRPIVGVAREPGRTIYLCGPAPEGHASPAPAPPPRC